MTTTRLGVSLPQGCYADASASRSQIASVRVAKQDGMEAHQVERVQIPCWGPVPGACLGEWPADSSAVRKKNASTVQGAPGAVLPEWDLPAFKQACMQRYAVSDTKIWAFSIAGHYAVTDISGIQRNDLGTVRVSFGSGAVLTFPDRGGLYDRLVEGGKPAETFGDLLIVLAALPDANRGEVIDACETENAANSAADRAADRAAVSLQNRLKALVSGARDGNDLSDEVLTPSDGDTILSWRNTPIEDIDMITVAFASGKHLVFRDDGQLAPRGALQAAIAASQPRTCKDLFLALSCSWADYRLLDEVVAAHAHVPQAEHRAAIGEALTRVDARRVRGMPLPASWPAAQASPATRALAETAVDYALASVESAWAAYAAERGGTQILKTATASELAAMTAKATVAHAYVLPADAASDERIGQGNILSIHESGGYRYIECEYGGRVTQIRRRIVPEKNMSTEQLIRDPRLGAANLVSVDRVAGRDLLVATYRDSSQVTFRGTGGLTTDSLATALTEHDYPDLATLFGSFRETENDIHLLEPRQLVRGTIDASGRRMLDDDISDSEQRRLAHDIFDARIRRERVRGQKLDELLTPTVAAAPPSLGRAIARQTLHQRDVRDILESFEDELASQISTHGEGEAIDTAALKDAVEQTVNAVVIPAIMALPAERRSDVGTRVLRLLGEVKPDGATSSLRELGIRYQLGAEDQEALGLGVTNPYLVHEGYTYRVSWHKAAPDQPWLATVSWRNRPPSYMEMFLQAVVNLLTYGKFVDNRRYIEERLRIDAGSMRRTGGDATVGADIDSGDESGIISSDAESDGLGSDDDLSDIGDAVGGDGENDEETER